MGSIGRLKSKVEWQRRFELIDWKGDRIPHTSLIADVSINETISLVVSYETIVI